MKSFNPSSAPLMAPVLDIIINHDIILLLPLIILQFQYCLEYPINSTHYYITIWAYQWNYFIYQSY